MRTEAVVGGKIAIEEPTLSQDACSYALQFYNMSVERILRQQWARSVDWHITTVIRSERNYGRCGSLLFSRLQMAALDLLVPQTEVARVDTYWAREIASGVTSSSSYDLQWICLVRR